MKKLCIYIILLSVSFFSCDRYVDSRDPVRSLPNTPNAPQNLSMQINDQSVTLSWTIPSTDGIVRYRIYASEIDTTNYRLIDSTTNMTVTINSLVQNRLYFFVVVGVTSSGLESVRSNRVSAQLGVLNMRINNNSVYTNTRAVQLQFTVPNTAANVIFSEDSTFSSSIYEPYTAQKSFQLSAGDGTKTVYARIRFANGSQTGSILSDVIILDTETSIDSVIFSPSGTIFEPGDTIRFALFTSEIGVARVTFSGSVNVNLADNGLGYDDIAADNIYRGGFIVPANTNLFNGLVTGSFTDDAGNSAPTVSSYQFLNINTPPSAVTLTGVLASGTATFNWTPSTTTDFESYRIYRSTSSNVNESNQLVYYGTVSGTRTFSYDPPFGTSYFRIYVVDQHGESAGSNTVQIIN